MGLRLSLDNSGSESSGDPTTTQPSSSSSNYHPSRTVGEQVETSARSRPQPNSSTESGCTDPCLGSVSIRLPQDETPEDVLLLRLLCSYHARSNQLANSGSGRSNSLSAADDGDRISGTPNPTGEASTSRIAQGAGASRARHSRHRSSWLGVTGESNAPSGRARGRRVRRTEMLGTTTRGSHWDSSESESEDEDYLNNLRLSSVMLRHFQLGASGRSRQLSVPITDSNLLRTLRLSAARIAYNVDRLTQDKGECCICLEDLSEGDVIARLPCLCIYHKKCIDMWFQRRPVCPVHPGD